MRLTACAPARSPRWGRLVETRGIKKIEPEDVAEAIVGALERPRFDVWVPRESGAISKVMQLLPRAGRERVAQLLKADRVLAGADPAVRASYEERASHSEPALESEDAGEPAKTASK